MKRIMQYVKHYWIFYIGGLTALGFGIFLDMFNPIFTGRIIDEVVVAGDTGIFAYLALMLLGITVGRSLFGYIKEMLFDYAGVSIASKLRQDLFDYIQSLSYNFFDVKNTGELMARIKEDADNIWKGTSFGIMLVIDATVSMLVATYLMFRISPKLSVITFIALPILGYLAIKLENTIGKTYEDISEQNAELNSVAQENIAGVRLVKAFAREKHEIKKFLKKNEGYYKLNYKQAKIWGSFYPQIELITSILPMFAIIIGGYFVVGNDMSIGTLVKFYGYTFTVIWPMRMIGWLANVMAEMFASVKKINTVFSYESEIKNKEDGIEVSEFKGDIVFDHVSLNLSDTEILKDISFKVEPNKTLAIMGATGSGKTSIINLLTRFYDYTSGTITIDGTPLADYDLHNLRSHIAVVMQEVFLFSDTIEENIMFGVKETTTFDEMLASSVSAQAHEFINRMENQYQTVIGEKGIGLSGGQKQRISIARAIAKKANILVFDDATSALDMETEYRIQHEIEAIKDVTKIIVAHRISAVKNADEIIVLEHGAIVERGTHQELIALRGRYYQTYCEQYEGFMAG